MIKSYKRQNILIIPEKWIDFTIQKLYNRNILFLTAGGMTYGNPV